MKFTNWTRILIIPIIVITMNNVLASPNSSTTTNTISHTYTENLANLLLAEIALQQDKPETAITYYLAILKTAADPAIAELALECALKYKLFDKAVEIATLWADQAPNDITPQIIATTLVLDALPKQAKTYILRAANIEPQEIDQYLLFTYTNLPAASQKNLAQILEQLVKENPQNPYIQVATAQIATQEDKIALAEQLITQALKLQPNLTHAIQLKAKLIRHTTNEDLTALKYLHDETIKNPNDEELKIFYSNALLDNNDSDTALTYLQALTKSKKHGMEAQFILGELFMEQHIYHKAYDMLIKVINDPTYGLAAKYKLGQICEQQNKPKDAINWYSDIPEGQFQVPATLRAALLLAMEGSYNQALQLVQDASPATFSEQKQLLLIELDLLIEMKETDHAMKLVNDTLALVPDDVDFLYARSLIANLLNIPTQTEKDLKSILVIQPNHANALNALGYTLSTQPKRADEAIAYLKKALKLSPDNPAFMDSMGWVLFRAGKIQDSIALLKNAYNLSKDCEIAAHLGEVLWTAGDKEQAKKIWHDALQNNPKHDILLETLNRLKVKFYQTPNAHPYKHLH